jgi:hypothetical protein
MTSDDRERLVTEKRWELAKSHLDRADQSANMMRGILFPSAGAAIAFVLQQKSSDGNQLHIISLMLFLSAAAFVFLSWDLQKRKSIARFEALLNNDLTAYDNEKNARPNLTLDRFSGAMFALGILFETLILFQT